MAGTYSLQPVTTMSCVGLIIARHIRNDGLPDGIKSIVCVQRFSELRFFRRHLHSAPSSYLAIRLAYIEIYIRPGLCPAAGRDW